MGSEMCIRDRSTSSERMLGAREVWIGGEVGRGSIGGLTSPLSTFLPRSVYTVRADAAKKPDKINR